MHKAEYTISANGMLVYRSATGMRMTRLVWRDLRGKEIGSLGASSEVYAPRLSLDDKRVAFELGDPDIRVAPIPTAPALRSPLLRGDH